jgi:hypothetical protein
MTIVNHLEKHRITQKKRNSKNERENIMSAINFDDLKDYTDWFVKIASFTVIPAIMWISTINSTTSNQEVKIKMLEDKITSLENQSLSRIKAIEENVLHLTKIMETNSAKLESLTSVLTQQNNLLQETRNDIRAINVKLYNTPNTYPPYLQHLQGN